MQYSERGSDCTFQDNVVGELGCLFSRGEFGERNTKREKRRKISIFKITLPRAYDYTFVRRILIEGGSKERNENVARCRHRDEKKKGIYFEEESHSLKLFALAMKANVRYTFRISKVYFVAIVIALTRNEYLSPRVTLNSAFLTICVHARLILTRIQCSRHLQALG